MVHGERPRLLKISHRHEYDLQKGKWFWHRDHYVCVWRCWKASGVAYTCTKTCSHRTAAGGFLDAMRREEILFSSVLLRFWSQDCDNLNEPLFIKIFIFIFCKNLSVNLSWHPLYVRKGNAIGQVFISDSLKKVCVIYSKVYFYDADTGSFVFYCGGTQHLTSCCTIMLTSMTWFMCSALC